MKHPDLWLFFVWLIPGAILSWLMRSSVPWVTFMSWYAIVVSHWAAYQAGKAAREVKASNGDV